MRPEQDMDSYRVFIGSGRHPRAERWRHIRGSGNSPEAIRTWLRRDVQEYREFMYERNFSLFKDF
ncbi:MAG: hypothetical protein OXC05_08455 [Halieaceae bacterium]|nr:hypothetical protein [Halieaceae bacterium]